MCGGEKKGKKRNAAPRAWRIKKEGEKKGKKEKKKKCGTCVEDKKRERKWYHNIFIILSQ